MEQTTRYKVATSMMEISRNQAESSSLNKHDHVPLIAKLLDSMISIIIICGVGIYRLTQPTEHGALGLLSCSPQYYFSQLPMVFHV